MAFHVTAMCLKKFEALRKMLMKIQILSDMTPFRQVNKGLGPMQKKKDNVFLLRL